MPLRLATPADAATIAAIYAPYVTGTAASFEMEPPEAVEMARRIGDIGERYPWLIEERGGVMTGYAYATRHRPRHAYRWCTEVSVYVRPSNQRNGAGRRLYTLLLDLLRLQGFVNAYAGITLPNLASVTFHEALGFEPFAVFRRIGFKLGAWHDVGWYLKMLAPHPAAPADPLPMPTLLQMPEVQELFQRANG